MHSGARAGLIASSSHALHTVARPHPQSLRATPPTLIASLSPHLRTDGFKLGAPVPWSTAFPFNAGFRHPQYVGGYSSQLGVMMLLASPATLSGGLVYLAIWWAVCYSANSVIEASGDADA